MHFVHSLLYYTRKVASVSRRDDAFSAVVLVVRCIEIETVLRWVESTAKINKAISLLSMNVFAYTYDYREVVPSRRDVVFVAAVRYVIIVACATLYLVDRIDREQRTIDFIECRGHQIKENVKCWHKWLGYANICVCVRICEVNVWMSSTLYSAFILVHLWHFNLVPTYGTIDSRIIVLLNGNHFMCWRYSCSTDF